MSETLIFILEKSSEELVDVNLKKDREEKNEEEKGEREMDELLSYNNTNEDFLFRSCVLDASEKQYWFIHTKYTEPNNSITTPPPKTI